MRNTGVRFSAQRIYALSSEELSRLRPAAEQVLVVRSALAVLHTLAEQIATLEKTVSKHLKHTPAYQQLLTVDGIGPILAQTIVLETGDIRRFATVGNYASYCRCVQSTTISNGKRKGQGNIKNGNKYLGWAYMEAAQFAIRYNARVQQFYQQKQAKTHVMVARKTIAHKLARACFYIMMRDRVPFDIHKAFG